MLVLFLLAWSPASAGEVCLMAGIGVGGAEAPDALSFSCGVNAGFSSSGTGRADIGYGAGAGADGNNSTNVGFGAGALAQGDSNTAIGTQAGQAFVGTGNVALGFQANRFLGLPTVNNSVAIGTLAMARTDGAIALGAGADAAHTNSIAIGAGVQTSRANQVVIGDASQTYSLAGIASAASRAQQVGDTRLVTSDANGNVATSLFSTQDMLNTMSAVNGQAAQIAALDGRVTAVQTEARQGIAAAIAMSAPAVPSAPGRMAWGMNVGHFNGATAFGGSLAYRFETSMPLVLSGGYSYGGGDSHAARLGLSGEF